MKKLLALVLALVMVLAATSAFAEDLLKIGYVQVGHESDSTTTLCSWPRFVSSFRRTSTTSLSTRSRPLAGTTF